jgi:hypothetical protein
MVSLFLITLSLPGQTYKFNSSESNMKKRYPLSNGQISPRLLPPDIAVPGNIDSIFLKNQDRSGLFMDSTIFDFNKTGNHKDFVVAEEHPGYSLFHGDHFIVKPDIGGKLQIKKPDPSTKYYLIINDPVRHRTTR